MTIADPPKGQSARTPRTPSSVLVVDANIILSVVLGRRSRPIFEKVVASRAVVTSARAAEEARSVLRSTPGLRRDASELVEALLGAIGVVQEAVYADAVEPAAQVLAQAVASGNGSTFDAHLLACAWIFDADLRSHDRDFAGSGWPSWSNANLSDSLDPEPA